MRGEALADGRRRFIGGQNALAAGDKQTAFSQELLTTDRQQAVNVLVVSKTVIWLLGDALVVLAAAMLWKSRRALAEGFRARLAPVPVPEVVA